MDQAAPGVSPASTLDGHREQRLARLDGIDEKGERLEPFARVAFARVAMELGERNRGPAWGINRGMSSRSTRLLVVALLDCEGEQLLVPARVRDGFRPMSR
jgi:hypothetical protein